MKNYYQLRYTRLNGGWDILKDETQTPNDAISSFTTTQNKNTTPPCVEFTESLELTIDGHYVFNTRVWSNCGNDSSGRPIMFAHAYSMLLNEYVKDPGGLLSIDEDAFNSNADAEIIQREITPGNMSISTALKALRINENIYNDLILRVYEILCGRMGRTLHILRSNWTFEDVKNCAFAICCALPFGLRKCFTFGTSAFPDGSNYTVLFTVKDKNTDESGYKLFFDLETGEKDCSNEMSISPEQFHLVNTIVEYNYDTENADRFFAGLDDKLIILGDERTVSLDQYDLASDMVRYDENEIIDDEKLSLFLVRLREIQNPGTMLLDLIDEVAKQLSEQDIDQPQKEPDINELLNNYKALVDQFESLKTMVDKMRAEKNKLETKIENLETKIENLEVRIKNPENISNTCEMIVDINKTDDVKKSEEQSADNSEQQVNTENDSVGQSSEPEADTDNTSTENTGIVAFLVSTLQKPYNLKEILQIPVRFFEELVKRFFER